MTAVISAIVLLGMACQDEIKIVPGEPGSTKWPLSGPADAPDGEELNLRSRRVVRRWDSGRKIFTESLAEGIQRTIVIASDKRFEGSLKHGVAGRHGVTLASADKVLASEKLALGQIEPVYSKGPEDIRVILEIVDKAQGFLDDIERVLLRKTGQSEKEREAFLLRVGEQVRKVDEMYERLDFTGTLALLRDAFFHIRNAQIWEEKDLPPNALDDPPRKKKAVFTDLDLTIEKLQKLLASVPEVLSLEIRVSTTLFLERLFAQAGGSDKKRESLRAVARAASKLAEAAPVQDRDVVRLLDKAADKSSDSAETREELLRSGTALVVQ